MAKHAGMLDAHVAYELARWSDEGLRATAQDEVSALYQWLVGVTLADTIGRADLLAAARRLLVEPPITNALIAIIEEGVKTVYAGLLASDTPLSQLLDRRQYDQLTETVVGLKPLRREITRQVVDSSVYAMLVSNVLYNGIKAFVLTENVFARKIPGASSLVKFGQSALSSAAPNLEKGVDKQLVSFIRSNIKEVLAESERYLNSVLDDTMIWQLADELWQHNAPRTTAALSAFVEPAQLVDMVDFGKQVALHFRTTPLFDTLLAQLLDGFMGAHGNKPIAELLEEIGIGQAQAVDALLTVAQPLVAQARVDGYLAARIRARLEPFYESYSGH